jgi:chondroitin 4-sulfotransferase 11
MISHKHKCIFLHIPKAAGTSIENSLRQIDPGIPKKVLRKRGFSRFLNDHLDYYVFSFVRNPYGRFVSAWKWGELKFSKEGGLPFYKKERSVSFGEYVLLTTDLDYRKDNQNLWSEYDEYHTLPQFEFFPHLNGGHYFTDEISPDFTCGFIGRFENLQEDFGEVCFNIGMQEFKLPHAYNSKTFRQDFDWTDTLKSKVFSYYKKDFDLFYPKAC